MVCKLLKKFSIGDWYKNYNNHVFVEIWGKYDKDNNIVSYGLKIHQSAVDYSSNFKTLEEVEELYIKQVELFKNENIEKLEEKEETSDIYNELLKEVKEEVEEEVEEVNALGLLKKAYKVKFDEVIKNRYKTQQLKKSNIKFSIFSGEKEGCWEIHFEKCFIFNGNLYSKFYFNNDLEVGKFIFDCEVNDGMPKGASGIQ
jgi:hypothetical protein